MAKEEKFYKNSTLYDLPKEERLHERLKKVGVDNLSLAELLALGTFLICDPFHIDNEKENSLIWYIVNT